jgi:hypothetical protein
MVPAVSPQLTIGRLQSTAGLLDSEQAILARLPSTTRSFADGEFIARDGDRSLQGAIMPSRSCIVRDARAREARYSRFTALANDAMIRIARIRRIH